MPRRIMLLVGAPAPSALSEEACTIKYFSEAFSSFVDKSAAIGSSSCSTPAVIAPWRSIPLNHKPLHTSFSQRNSFIGRSFLNDDHNGEDFLCPSSLGSSVPGSNDEDVTVLNEFCEQSLALHNSLPSSQLGDDCNAATTFMEETSFLSNSTATNIAGVVAPTAPIVPPAHLSDLEDVPTAKQVISLQPQTITLNIIVGILSISQPRSVTTRWGQTLSLIEILVGDETRSGFAVTFWLANDAVAASEIPRLRRQDVVLLQNVALHVFRGKVYGQSLRRGQTKVHLLWSNRQDAKPCYSSKALRRTEMPAIQNPQLAKTITVRDWVIRFVGADPAATTRKEQHVWDQAPADTQ